jgi:glucose-1-phosphate thymidylyltransferase
MKCVLLAAGYATRLYPLTRNMPKSLLPVGNRTILERILEKVERVDEIDEVVLVSNARFFDQFEAFVGSYRSAKRYSVLNDGTTDNDKRLGAIADLKLAVDRKGIDEDTMVLAGDNLFDFGLDDFARFFRQKQADCITAHRLEDLAELRRTGVVELSEDRRVLSFQEKPAEPKSTWAVPPFYLYRRETLPLLDEYLASGENPDAPGHFVPWLAARRPVYAFTFEGRRYDIGNLESYEEAKRVFGNE